MRRRINVGENETSNRKTTVTGVCVRMWQFSRQAVYGKARNKYIFDRLLRVSRSSKIFERANTDRGLSELFPTIHATIEQR